MKTKPITKLKKERGEIVFDLDKPGRYCTLISVAVLLDW